MKKLIMVLTVVMVLLSTFVLAEELPAGTNGQDPFHFATFGEAVEAAIETAEEGESPYGSNGGGYCAALIKQNGRFFRAVAFFDERGKELCAAYLDAAAEQGEIAMEEYKALDAYLMTLPVQYTEELTIVPLSQEELDAMAGMTLGEAILEPCGMVMRGYPEDAEDGKDVVFRMVKGFCEYELTVNEPAGVYRELRAADHDEPFSIMSMNHYLNLTVRSVKYSRPSHNVLNLDWQADGTLSPNAF